MDNTIRGVYAWALEHCDTQLQIVNALAVGLLPVLSIAYPGSRWQLRLTVASYRDMDRLMMGSMPLVDCPPGVWIIGVCRTNSVMLVLKKTG